MCVVGLGEPGAAPKLRVEDVLRAAGRDAGGARETNGRDTEVREADDACEAEELRTPWLEDMALALPCGAVNAVVLGIGAEPVRASLECATSARVPNARCMASRWSGVGAI